MGADRAQRDVASSERLTQNVLLVEVAVNGPFGEARVGRHDALLEVLDDPGRHESIVSVAHRVKELLELGHGTQIPYPVDFGEAFVLETLL